MGKLGCERVSAELSVGFAMAFCAILVVSSAIYVLVIGSTTTFFWVVLWHTTWLTLPVFLCMRGAAKTNEAMANHADVLSEVRELLVANAQSRSAVPIAT